MVNKPKWSEEEDKLVRLHYATKTAREIAELLEKRNTKSVHTRAKVLGLSKYKPRGNGYNHPLGYPMIYFPLCPYSWADGRVYMHCLI